MFRREVGFTVIGLSIAVICLGVLIGVVVVGSEMLHGSRIRKLIKQHDLYESAVTAFSEKYHCLPGDCASAHASGVGVSTGFGQDGNGNLMIEYVNLRGAIGGYETQGFWHHLSAAKLIDWTSPASTSATNACRNSTSETSPCIEGLTNALGAQGGWWIIHPQDERSDFSGYTGKLAENHYWWLAATLGGGSGAAIFLPADAQAFDAKLDDGLPLSGSILAAGDDNANPVGAKDAALQAGGPLHDACISSSETPHTYNTENLSRRAGNLCSLLVKAGF